MHAQSQETETLSKWIHIQKATNNDVLLKKCS